MRRAGLPLSLALVLAACGARNGKVHSAIAASSGFTASPAVMGASARWFPVIDDAEPRLLEMDADGSERIVERGLRLVEHTDGRLERADELLPDGPLGAVALPPRIGEGFVFYSVADESTRLWRAPSWTGKLAPLARLPFEAAEVRAGLDRVYAVSTRTRAMVGIDVAAGAVIGRGPIPASPAYGGMAFADAWLGAVEVDIRGALVTFDAGLTFHPVRAPMTVPGVFEQGGRIVLGTTRGAFALEPSGELERVDGPGGDSAITEPSSRGRQSAEDEGDGEDDNADVPKAAGLLGPRPLEVAVLRGMPDSAGSAVVLANGALARVDLADGRILAVDAHAAPTGATCKSIRLFGGIGFVCGEHLGPTTVYAYRPPLRLAPALYFEDPRIVSASGTGALAIRGTCPGSGPSQDATYCIVSAEGRSREIRVRGDVGAERVVALADGRAVVVVPPRLGVAGQLTTLTEDGRAETVPISLDGLPGDAQKLVARGLWLDGMDQADRNRLGAWVAGSSSFVGIRLDLDGKVVAGTVRENVGRASLSGQFALVTDDRGGGRQTTDGGNTWYELALPAAADPAAASAADHERGCSPVGCSIGQWLRVGWSKGSDSGALKAAAEPPIVKSPPSPFVSWALECSPTGESEGPREAAAGVHAGGVAGQKPSLVADSSRGSLAELDSTAFRPFLGVPAPSRAADDLGLDFGTEDQTIQIRGYAWGARSAPWDRAGSWLLRVADRFSVRQAIWSTAASRTPWPDAEAAAEMFGSEPSHRISSEWMPFLDPMGEGGVVVLRAGTTTELSIVEREHAIVVVKNADELIGDRSLSGVVKVDGKWYLGFVPGPRAFEVFGTEGGELSVLASYPRYSDEGEARVVRTTAGSGLGIWVVAHGQDGTRGGGDTWYVYPIDARTGSASLPIVVTRTELAHAPRPCEPEEDGWVLVHDVSPSVAKLEFTHVSEMPSVARVAARLKLGTRGLCLDALAAQLDGDPPKDLKMRGAPAWPARTASLALSDRVSDRRWGFRCAP
ncbi:MAG TPA: hypothetical protein VHU80_17170 [Polyangiaceae bacterium]|jgi:hypothetical protein|nr:hypothetical protein [Polyangiaceae bacterium]